MRDIFIQTGIDRMIKAKARPWRPCRLRKFTRKISLPSGSQANHYTWNQGFVRSMVLVELELITSYSGLPGCPGLIVAPSNRHGVFVLDFKVAGGDLLEGGLLVAQCI